MFWTKSIIYLVLFFLEETIINKTHRKQIFTKQIKNADHNYAYGNRITITF